MESDNSLLPIDILEVESKPNEYKKRFIIPSAPYGYRIKTESDFEVHHCIQKEDILNNIVLVNVPTNTTKLYVYPRLDRDDRMTKPQIIIHASQECKNPPEQVFFKRVELKESVNSKDGEKLEIDFDTEQ